MERPDDIVIVSAVRTPIGRFNGSLKAVPAIELGGAVVSEALARAGIPGDAVDEVLLGNVIQAGVGQAPARQAALKAGLPATVGATTINKVCGSGLKAAMLGAAMLSADDADVIVAGGMESMNSAPFLLPRARFGYRLGTGEIIDAMIHDGLWCQSANQHMGNAAEWIAATHNISRTDMDRHALQSHMRAAAATARGAFAAEITPIMGQSKNSHGSMALLAQDECIRADTSLDRLGELAPAFASGGRVTAGNSSAISDGAAAVVLMRREVAQSLGCPVRLAVRAYAQAAVEPRDIFTAPAVAIHRLMQRASLTVDKIGLFEINEAFSAQILANVRELGLDWERVNVNGGSVALGHPIGASAARILVTLAYALLNRGARLGVCAACLGGGEAVAMLVENQGSAT